MPIVPAKWKKDLEDKIFKELESAHGDVLSADPKQKETMKKNAKVFSIIAEFIAEKLLSEVQVAPGIPVATVGSPAAQSGTTTGPGKLS